MAIALRKPTRLGGLRAESSEDDMKVILRRATEADAKHAASLLTELRLPVDRGRCARSPRSFPA